MADQEIGWIAAIIIGGLAGWLAERQSTKSDTGVVMNIILGIVGAAVASAILSFFGIVLGGWVGYLIAGFIGACLLIAIVRVVRDPRRVKVCVQPLPVRRSPSLVEPEAVFLLGHPTLYHRPRLCRSTADAAACWALTALQGVTNGSGFREPPILFLPRRRCYARHGVDRPASRHAGARAPCFHVLLSAAWKHRPCSSQ